MSEVRMSLQEYDELKEKLNLYEEILEALTTPTTDNWNIQWFKEHHGSTLSVHSNPRDNLSAKAYNYLLQLSEAGADKFIEEHDLSGEMTFEINYSFGCLSHEHDPDRAKEVAESN